MGDIYQHSYLTLAATKAHSSEDGLYNGNNEFSSAPISSNDQIGTDTTLYCRKRVPRWYHTADWRIHRRANVQAPLLRRAWVFQEILLSPRILHFGAAELLWECCEQFTCECTSMVPSVPRSYPKIHHSISLNGSSQESHARMWRNIVEAYTLLDITNPNDRLPALQGIASQLFRGDAPLKLLSGLWEGTPFLDLLWYTKPIRSWSEFEVTRANPWRAPTWAWASMDAEVLFHKEARELTRYATIEGISTRDREDDRRTIMNATMLQISVHALSGSIVYDLGDFIKTKWVLFDNLQQLACERL
jgi:hypothetical protein